MSLLVAWLVSVSVIVLRPLATDRGVSVGVGQLPRRNGMDLATERALHLRRPELGEEEGGDRAEELADERTEDRLMDHGADAVVRTPERVQDGRTQHVVQVHLSRLRKIRLNGRRNYNFSWYLRSRSSAE